MEKIKNTRILALIGIIGLILGSVFPYVQYSFFGQTMGIKLWNYWQGKLVVALALANCLLIFKDYIEKYVPQLFETSFGKQVARLNNPKLSLVPTLIIVAFAIYLYTEINGLIIKGTLGLGFYSLWIGIICSVGHAIFYKKETSESQTGQTITYQQTSPNQQVQSTFSNPSNQQVNMNVNTNSIKYCPGCGQPNNNNASQCFMCGKELQ